MSNTSLEIGTWRQAALTTLLLALPLSGCASRSAPAASRLPAAAPLEIQVDGRVWRQQAMTDADRQVIDRYLLGNAAIAENPTLEGSLVLYVDERGHRRAYWIYSVESSRQWLYLEFDNRQRFVGLDEGVDGPLALAQSST